jgi:exosome complex RNA-binding protein Rrp4
VNPKSITIDGVEYAPVQSSGEVRIVIGQRGFVWVGYYRHEGEVVTLTGARNIRKWGTTRGLGELVDGPISGSTVLDPAGIVEVHKLAVVATIHVDADAWSGYLG